MRLSKNRVGSVRNLLKTSRRNELMTLRPIQPSEYSVANPAMPRAMKIAMNAIGSHLAVSRFCATSASSISGSSRYTRLASISAVAAMPITAMTPTTLCGST